MILITGATGLIGRALVTQCLALEMPVRLQVRSKPCLQKLFPDIVERKQVEIVECDFVHADQNLMAALCRSCTAVIHTAGLVHQPQADEELYAVLNVRATELLAEAARQNGVKQFVFMSTIAVYGSAFLDNATEEQPTIPDTAYGLSKLACEKFLAANVVAPCVMVFRPALVFGEGDRGNMLSLVRQINSGRYFHIGGATACKSLIYSMDMARAILLGLELNLPGHHVFNIANPEAVSMRDLAVSIGQILGKEIPTIPELPVRLAARVLSPLLGAKFPLTTDRLDKLTRSTQVSIKKFQDLCRFTPAFTVQQALRAEIDWAKAGSQL